MTCETCEGMTVCSNEIETEPRPAEACPVCHLWKWFDSDPKDRVPDIDPRRSTMHHPRCALGRKP